MSSKREGNSRLAVQAEWITDRANEMEIITTPVASHVDFYDRVDLIRLIAFSKTIRTNHW